MVYLQTFCLLVKLSDQQLEKQKRRDKTEKDYFESGKSTKFTPKKRTQENEVKVLVNDHSFTFFALT